MTKTGAGNQPATDGQEWLDAQRISAQSQQSVHVVDSVDSTNRLALQALLASPAVASGTSWLAEEQTAGRGRRGRQWQSPKGANIYLSMAWQFQAGQELGCLSLVTGIAVAKCLQREGVQAVGLKWPNDIVVSERKLGGILLEMQSLSGQAGKPHGVAVGIGLNVCMPAAAAAAIDQRWTDLQTELTATPSRNEIAAALVRELTQAFQRFEQDGFHAFLPDWRSLDALYGREITVHQGDQRVVGVAAGVADDGALLVQTGDAEQRFYGGEVSVRASSEQGTS